MDKLLYRLLDKELPALVRFGGTTLLIVALGAGQYLLALRTGLPGLSGVLAGIFLASFLFGRFAGFYGTVLAAVFAYIVLQMHFPTVPIGAALVLFTAMGLAIAQLTGVLRSALHRAITAEREKDLLFRELSHRAQNNIALIVAMVQLQRRTDADPQVKAALDSVITRITALGEAQKHFRQAQTETVDLASYLESLCDHLRGSFGEAGSVTIRCTSDHVTIPAEKALALGLIANEFVTNAVKYAFPDGRAGAIDVSAKAEGTAVILGVSDNGLGCAQDAKPGLGTRLADMLVRQHGAAITRDNTSPGYRARVTMPVS